MSDVSVFNESGKGYWMEGVGCLRANETSSMGAHLVVLGCDVYNFEETGNIACCLNASSGASSTHSGPSVLIQNMGVKE